MSSYAEFCIQGVIPDLSQKRIIIQTNFKVDPDSVSLKTVAYYNYDKKMLESYSLTVDNKNIYIELADYPTNESRYYLKISQIKDALGRVLLTNFDDYIKFTNDVKTKIGIIAPISRETLKTREVLVDLKVTDFIDDIYYRVEIARDNVFFNSLLNITCSSQNKEIYNNEEDSIILEEANSERVRFRTTVNEDGQLYIRARAELSEDVVGDWSETISFNVYTINMNSMETTFLEDYLTTEDLFDDSIDLSEAPVIVDRTSNGNLDPFFYLEFDKEIKLEEPYVLDGNSFFEYGYIYGKRKIGTKQKERVRFKMLVDPDDAFCLRLEAVDMEIEPDSKYTFNLKNIIFEDDSVFKDKIEIITTPSSNYYVSIDDVKEHMKGLEPSDEEIISHITDAGKTAKYWMKQKADARTIPEFDIETIQEDYYPFYMFIKYHAIVESLKAFYMDMLTHPYKWRDVLSDLEREEEWDLDAIKDLIDDYEKEADEWLELVVTITADPKWALRGKYCYSTYNTYTNPYHRIHWGQPPHNTDYNRGY